MQLGPRLNEQEADWWINSRSYFEGEYVEPVARPIPRGNMSEIPSSYYKELQEQRRDLELLKEKKTNEAELFEQMRVFMERMNAPPPPPVNTTPIIASQHVGLSNFSCFQSSQV